MHRFLASILPGPIRRLHFSPVRFRGSLKSRGVLISRHFLQLLCSPPGRVNPANLMLRPARLTTVSTIESPHIFDQIFRRSNQHVYSITDRCSPFDKKEFQERVSRKSAIKNVNGGLLLTPYLDRVVRFLPFCCPFGRVVGCCGDDRFCDFLSLLRLLGNIQCMLSAMQSPLLVHFCTWDQ